MYKNNITNIVCINDKVTFLYKGDYQSAANLRNFIKNNLYSYLINKVIFYQNDSHASNEHLASTRFGLLILNNKNIIESATGYLHIVGPKLVMAADIKGLSFVHDAPIVYLRVGEVLKCEFSVVYDCGTRHQKWNPAAATTFYFLEEEGGYEFNFELIGMLSVDDIMSQIP
jgi:hypothetical protein